MIETEQTRLGFWEGRGGLTEEKVNRIIHKHGAAAAEDVAQFTKTTARDLAPKRSRTFMFSIDKHLMDRGDPVVWEVRSSMEDLALWLEEGTGIYGPLHQPIVPVRARELKYPDRRTGKFTVFDTPRAGVELRTPGGRFLRRAPYIFKDSVAGQRPKHTFRKAARLSEPFALVRHRQAARLAAAELRLISP